MSMIASAVAPGGHSTAASRLHRQSRLLTLFFTGLLAWVILMTAVIVAVALFYGGTRIGMANGMGWVYPDTLPPGFVPLSAFPFPQRLAGAASFTLMWSPAILVVAHLRGLFALYAEGIVFAQENAWRIRRIGLWLIAWAAAPTAGHLLVTAAGILDRGWLRASSVHALILGVLLLVIAQVMELGRQIEQERSEFV
jgi:hypothetical protein